jgi:hypothetical protein
MAVWFAHGKQLLEGTVFDCVVVAAFERQSDAEFAARARNAFDVMVRRGWYAERFSLLGGGFAWRIPMDVANDMVRQHGANACDFKSWASLRKFDDPFAALVEADKWYRDNVEKGGQ